MKWMLLALCFNLSFFTVSAQCNGGLTLGSDTSVCPNISVTLDAGVGYLVYEWQDNSTQQTFQANQEGTYYCRAGNVDSSVDLINNGDFEQGNILFTSDYTYYPVADVFGPNASYGIVSNPNAWFNPFAACPDQTSGSGNMMVADGSSTNGGNDAVWCQSVAVNPNGVYEFSYWSQNLTGAPLADLRVEINGQVLGSALTPSPPCNWQETAYTWNSNGVSMANICIYDNELGGNGNDFAIDEISLHPYCWDMDTMEISWVDQSDSLFREVDLCFGDSAFINGAWRFNSGTFYTDTTNNGCSQIIETLLEFSPNLSASAGNDQVITLGNNAELLGTSSLPGSMFSWTSSNGSTNSNASFIVSPSQTMEYYLEVTRNGCSDWDTVVIFIEEVSVELIVPNAFSPNGDNINDKFGLVNFSEFETIELSIYNRWGELVHKADDFTHAWDGTFKSRNVPVDVYIYVLKAKPITSSTEVSTSGNLMLIR